MNILMKCGHLSNAKYRGNPICIICNCYETKDGVSNLKDRKAKCIYCERTEASSTKLCLFKFMPDKKLDSYYCGCKGWD